MAVRLKITPFAEQVHALAKEKGWWEGWQGTPEQIGSRLALIHAEVSEALEDLRHTPDDLHLKLTPGGKPVGFVVELADVIIRVCDLAEGLGLNLEAALGTKHGYNESRSHRHGGKAL